MPSDCPLGTIVALCIGRAPSVNSATSACPPSWYAVSLLFSSATTADLGPFHTRECRGGVERRQLELKGAEGGD
jgi:hypothetical protein